jgi:hypothetical protein
MMQSDVNNESTNGLISGVDDVVKNVAAGISVKVKRKYGIIDLAKIPNHVNYAKVEKYLLSIDIEITRRMFITYLNEKLLPDGHEVKNSNYTYYSREQIIYYILVDMFKPILPLGKVKVLFAEHRGYWAGCCLWKYVRDNCLHGWQVRRCSYNGCC